MHKNACINANSNYLKGKHPIYHITTFYMQYNVYKSSRLAEHPYHMMWLSLGDGMSPLWSSILFHAPPDSPTIKQRALLAPPTDHVTFPYVLMYTYR